jgi:hypothetical protein
VAVPEIGNQPGVFWTEMVTLHRPVNESTNFFISGDCGAERKALAGAGTEEGFAGCDSWAKDPTQIIAAAKR